MKTLFIEADEPLLIFPSIEVAERCLEATDVRAGTYRRAYGSMGEIYEITVSGGHVAILRSDTPPRPDDLKALIGRYLQAVGETAPGDADLAMLVAAVEAQENAFWSEHDPYGERFSKRLPWWGCLAASLAFAAAIYLVSHLFTMAAKHLFEPSPIATAGGNADEQRVTSKPPSPSVPNHRQHRLP